MVPKRLLHKTFMILAIVFVMLKLSAWADDYAYEVTSRGQFGFIDLTTGVFMQLGRSGLAICGLGEYRGKLYGVYNSTLYQINPANGALAQVGKPVSFRYRGFASTTGGLYGFDPDMNLYSIDPSTGGARLMGLTGLSNPGGFGVSTGSQTLYITPTPEGSQNTALYSVNTTTGGVTLIGSTGFYGSGGSVLVNGTLYAGVFAPVAVYNLNTQTWRGMFVARVSHGGGYFYGLAPTLGITGALLQTKQQVAPRSESDNYSKATIAIAASQPWTPTGIQLQIGDDIAISATGIIQTNLKGARATPAGTLPDCMDVGRVNVPFVAPELPCWSLLGRIGPTGNIFEVGASRHFRANASGELYLGVNDNFFGDNSGQWQATVVGGRPPELTGTNALPRRVLPGCNGQLPSKHLTMTITSVDLSTGRVTVNGLDDRRPQRTPFTWVWGDNSATQGWFPQSHTFANTQQNYLLQVISHEDDGSTDCAQIIIAFGAGYDSESSIGDGSQNSINTSPLGGQNATGAWFGFANDTSPQDREVELRQNCGAFKRIDVPDAVGDSFTDLCRSVRETCERVCDWQGTSFPCDAVSLGGARDGSRIALCR